VNKTSVPMYPTLISLSVFQLTFHFDTTLTLPDISDFLSLYFTVQTRGIKPGSGQY